MFLAGAAAALLYAIEANENLHIKIRPAVSDLKTVTERLMLF